MYYPAFLNLKNKLVVLFGGVHVALRKARVLVRSGANLKVLSRDFSPAFLAFAKRNRIQIRRGSRLPSSIRGISLVVCATSDPDFNRRIYERCVRSGLFVNVVDDPKHSTFLVPSVMRRGLLQIAVSTGGASPLLAKLIRKKLEEEFGSEYRALLRSLHLDRERSKRLIRLGRKRRNHFQKLVGSKLKLLEARRFR